MADPAPAFALFVSSVAGMPVTRFGTRTLIGAARRHLEPTIVDYTPELIVPLPADEYARYRREYNRALANGSLRRRSAEDWRAQNTPVTPTPEIFS
jgi:hypothetical protein